MIETYEITLRHPKPFHGKTIYLNEWVEGTSEDIKSLYNFQKKIERNGLFTCEIRKISDCMKPQKKIYEFISENYRNV